MKALGLVLAGLVTSVLTAQTAPCIPEDVLRQCLPDHCLEGDRCPTRGCAQSDTPEAEANQKRKTRPSGSPIVLEIDDFESLQITANKLGIQGFAVAIGQRKRYRRLRLPRTTEGKARPSVVGEGDGVSVRGYIVGVPHARRTDSANCKLVGRANNSYVIHIARLADDTEFDSIVAELIPQSRDPTWTLEKLRKIVREKRPVVVTGQLFYDNKHLVNSDPDDDLTGHPKRLSLWEIHPVTQIDICNEYPAKLDRCRERGAPWKSLSEWVASKP